MSRFHTTLQDLEADGAMQEYRKAKLKDPEVFDPAEWIEALHKEHWEVLRQLAEAKAQTEGDRLAETFCKVREVISRLQRAETLLDSLYEKLHSVLGDTPTVQGITVARTSIGYEILALQSVVK